MDAHGVSSSLAVAEDVVEPAEGSPLLPPMAPPELCRCDIVLVVGEPGLMKTLLAKRLLQSRSLDAPQPLLTFLKANSHELAKRLEYTLCKARAVARKQKDQLVCVLFDDFPALDEETIDKATELIRAAAVEGVTILITLCPEAEQLCEELPEAYVLAGRELLYRMPLQPNDLARRAWSMTNGIPLLARALTHEVDPHAPRYLESLQRVVIMSLRNGIPLSELRIRYAMMLLGSGNFEQLRQILPTADDETLAWMQAEAPFFQVNVYTGSFCCAGIDDISLFRLCFPSLRQYAGLYADIVEQAFSVLCRSQNFVRAGICGALLPTTDSRSKLLMPWGVELCAAGALGIIKDCLAAARQLFMKEEVGYLESAAAYALIEQKQMVARQAFAAVVDQQKTRGAKLQFHGNSALLLRMLAQGRSLAMGDKLVGIHDKAARVYPELLLHLELRQLLFEGQFHRVLERFTEESPWSHGKSLAELLLINDLVLATAFGGEIVGDELNALLVKAEQALIHSRSQRLMDYQLAVSELVAIAGGSCSSGFLERAAARAESMGDRMLRAVFSLALALSELRNGNLSSAHVRAQRAVDLAAPCEFDYIDSCARLVEAVIAALAGDAGPLRRMAETKKEKSIPQDLARLLLSFGADVIADGNFHIESACPQNKKTQRIELQVLNWHKLQNDALWLVSWLINDCAEISQLCRLKMPKHWIAALLPHSVSTQKMTSVTTARHSSSPAQTDSPHLSQRSHATEQLHYHVVINLLGGLSVSVDGHPIEMRKFNRRQSKVLLALLAAKENHRMRRVELANQIWPDATLELGMQRLYEAISGARKAMESRYRGFEPFLTNKADGTVALNPEVVVCDVDCFVEAVHSCAVNDGIADEVINAACEVRDLYLGDMDVTTINPEPWISLRAENLRSMFVAVMVTGSRTALLQGKVQLAIQFARSAVSVQCNREDAITVLIEALVAAGRPGDARDAYLRFCSRVVGSKGLPPSRELRRLVADLIPEPKQSSHSHIAREDVIGA